MWLSLGLSLAGFGLTLRSIEARAGRIFALLGIGALTELLLAVHAGGVNASVVTAGLWGYGLAWVVSAAALAGARAHTGDDTLEAWSGLAARLPRTATALAVAALLWAGLPGTFTLAVGHSSEDLPLRAELTIDGELRVVDGARVMTTPVTVTDPHH